MQKKPKLVDDCHDGNDHKNMWDNWKKRLFANDPENRENKPLNFTGNTKFLDLIKNQKYSIYKKSKKRITRTKKDCRRSIKDSLTRINFLKEWLINNSKKVDSFNLKNMCKEPKASSQKNKEKSQFSGHLEKYTSKLNSFFMKRSFRETLTQTTNVAAFRKTKSINVEQKTESLGNRHGKFIDLKQRENDNAGNFLDVNFLKNKSRMYSTHATTLPTYKNKNDAKEFNSFSVPQQAKESRVMQMFNKLKTLNSSQLKFAQKNNYNVFLNNDHRSTKDKQNDTKPKQEKTSKTSLFERMAQGVDSKKPKEANINEKKYLNLSEELSKLKLLKIDKKSNDTFLKRKQAEKKVANFEKLLNQKDLHQLINLFKSSTKEEMDALDER